MPPMEMRTFAQLMNDNMEALILGASGLIGSELLKIILNDPSYTSVKIVVRTKLPIDNSKLSQIISDFDGLESSKDQLTGDVVFSCLGSTNAKTPDQKEYYKIDHDYPLKAGGLALINGAKYLHIVSSLGSDSSSSSSYLKMKGETEEDISNLPFTGIHIYRPALITGQRKEKRPLEDVAAFFFSLINPLLVGPFQKYKSIAAKDIAVAMATQAKKEIKGIHIYPSNKIKELA